MKKMTGYLIPVYAITLLGFLIAGILGNRIITVISENAPMENRHCFIVDAGHGGVDGGAVSTCRSHSGWMILCICSAWKRK